MNLTFLSQQILCFSVQQKHDLINSTALTVLITVLTVAVEETVGISLLVFANSCLDSRGRVREVELAERESTGVVYWSSKQKSFACGNEVWFPTTI